MIDLADASNGVTFYNDYQWNSIKNNIIDLIESTGQTPVSDTGVADSNVLQISIANAIHAAGGNFYVATGTANAIVLGVQTISGTAMRAPNVYFNGMTCRFSATNTNTGSATANIAGLGIKTIKKQNYTADLISGDIVSGSMYDLVYSTATGFLELKPVLSTGDLPVTGAQGAIIQKGTLAWESLAIGTVGQIPTVNSGATAIEYQSRINFIDTNVVNNQAIPGTWTDVSLASVVGANTCQVFLRITALGGTTDIAFRVDGETADVGVGSGASAAYGAGTSGITVIANNIGYLLLKTSSSGIIEVKKGNSGSNYSLDIIGYIK